MRAGFAGRSCWATAGKLDPVPFVGGGVGGCVLNRGVWGRGGVRDFKDEGGGGSGI